MNISVMNMIIAEDYRIYFVSYTSKYKICINLLELKNFFKDSKKSIIEINNSCYKQFLRVFF